jgi:hypothetical protein
VHDINARFLELGLAIPRILLPRPPVDLSRWAVLACDQFTQDRSYWDRVRRVVGDKPSTLRLIYPEVFLNPRGASADGDSGGREGRIAAIHRTMASYLEGEVFAPAFRGCVYLERDSPWRRGRRGLVAAVDLDRYDWENRAGALIRATEGTVPERLPPRMDIRRRAPLESSHVLLLINDDREGLLEGLAGLTLSTEPAYRGDLMLGAGALRGWRLDREEQWAFIAEKLEALSRGGGGFLYAVGDGNHSLAAAKAVWEEYRAGRRGEPGLAEDPRRFALVEIENLYDPALVFEPIHRIIFGAGLDALLKALAPLPGLRVILPEGSSPEQVRRLVGDRDSPLTRLGLVSGARCLALETDAPGLAVAALQPLLDRFTAGGASIDYIHGEEELFRLAGAPSEDGPPVGILLPPVRKEGLFETVARSGPLPRKSFSLGEGVEKRFYLECRSLIQDRL